MKKILTILTLALAFPIAVLATPVGWEGNYSTQILEPLKAFQSANVKGSYFTATTTAATSTFAGNLMIGNSMFNGQLDISSLGTGVAQLQVSTSTNDFAKVAFGNMSAGTASMFCNIYNNGRSTRAGVGSAYYGGICFAGHNYNTAGFDGIKPNGIALFASDGDVSIGSASMNAASSSIRFFTGGNAAAFSAAGQDMILQGGTGYLGIGTGLTAPSAQLTQKSTVALQSAPLGTELTDATGWTSTDWTGDYANGFTHTAGNTTALSRTMTISANTLYQVSVVVTGRTAGSFTIALGYATSTSSFGASNATFTFGPKTLSTGANAPLVFTPSSTFDGKIASISVKAITGTYNPTYAILDSTGAVTYETRSSLASLGNTFQGVGAGRYNTTGSNNSVQGLQALYTNTTGSNNSAQGYASLYSNITGSNNSAQGYASLYSNTTGNYNTAQGMYSLYANTTGLYNSAQGYSALNANTTGSYNSAQGTQVLYSNTTGTYNSAQGMYSLYSNTTGSYNSAQGYSALNANTTGLYNSALGTNSLYYNQSATNTVAVGANAGRGTADYYAQGGTYLGYQAGYSAGSGGDYNTMLGYEAGYNTSTGDNALYAGYRAGYYATSSLYSTYLGYEAGRGNTGTHQQGDYNTAIGYKALNVNTTGQQNTANGMTALFSNTTGANNNAFGAASLFANTIGVNNTANGTASLYANTIGNYNTALGYATLYTSITGSNNTAIGYQALRYNNSATNTTAVGYNAGAGVTTNYYAQGGTYLGYQAGYSAGSGGDYNTLLGYQAGYNVSTGKYNIILGQNVNATSSNSGAGLNIGNVLFGTGMYTGSTVSATPTTDGRIGIGTSSPMADLQVNDVSTSTISVTSVNGSTRSTTRGGKIILQDMAGGTCTEITTQSGVMSSRAVTCP